MDITLPPSIERLVAEQIRSGAYSSPEEVVAAGLELLAERQGLEERRARLLREIDLGIVAARAGATVPLDKVRSEVLRRA
jgi:antitoxin ParD1/3/4